MGIKWEAKREEDWTVGSVGLVGDVGLAGVGLVGDVGSAGVEEEGEVGSVGDGLVGDVGLVEGAVDGSLLGADGSLVPGVVGLFVPVEGVLGVEGSVGFRTSAFSHVPGIRAMGRSHVAVSVTPFPMSKPLMALQDHATKPPM